MKISHDFTDFIYLRLPKMLENSVAQISGDWECAECQSQIDLLAMPSCYILLSDSQVHFSQFGRTVEPVVHHGGFCFVHHKAFGPVFHELPSCSCRKLTPSGIGYCFITRCWLFFGRHVETSTKINMFRCFVRHPTCFFPAPAFPGCCFRAFRALYSVSRLRGSRPVMTGTFSCSRNFSLENVQALFQQPTIPKSRLLMIII